MKKIFYLLMVVPILSISIYAGSISGEITYSGNQTATIYIAAFDNPSLNGEPTSIISIEQLGFYVIDSLVDGTYYIAAAMCLNPENMKHTDPYGFWATTEELIPITISDNNAVTNINITLIDGTDENPNPWGDYYVEPNYSVALPIVIQNGVHPNIVFNENSLYLFKHDAEDAPSGKIYEIDYQTGEIINTLNIKLESVANGISWIDKMVYRNGELWANGGYGDPAGTNMYFAGVFKIDIHNCTSSLQIPSNYQINLQAGFACDGTNFYVVAENTLNERGIIKFNPDQVSEIPTEFFINLGEETLWNLPLSYGNGYLWLGFDRIHKVDPNSGELVEILNLPASAAEAYDQDMFWTYDEYENTLKAYNNPTVDVEEDYSNNLPLDFTLLQNYPNPFNPTTTISYFVPSYSFVKISVYDVLGKIIEELVNEEKSAGFYEINFDASNLSSGTYLYRMQAGNNIITKKLLLMK